jgi:transcriptional regulator with XRE-family HTH domain
VPEHSPTPLAFALICLRSAAGWSRIRLAHALGRADESLISAYERGAKSLTREKLEALLDPLGHPPEVIDVLLLAHDLIFSQSPVEALSPVALSKEERRALDRATMAAGWTAGRIAAEGIRAELIRRRKQEKAAAARREAEGLFRGLMAGTRQERSGLVEVFPEYRSWALAVRVCEASVRSAAHKAEEALDLAQLALSIAERVPGEESWRSRLKGYCWAHLANARRVANDLAGSEEAFGRAWDLWRAGAASDPAVLAEWWLFSLEASLRRAQHRFLEAVKLLDQAQAASKDNQVATVRILLKKGNVFEQMGDSESALAALREAAPLVEGTGDPHLSLGLRFDTANNLYHLERYAEAAELMPELRELAVRQAYDLDLVRVSWLAARLAASQGKTEEAAAALEQVRRDFTARELPYDAALSSLDLAVLWLQAGRTPEVKALAVAMGWIFQATGIHREALAALSLFCNAARQESATVDLARQAVDEIERARRSASPSNRGRDRG